MTLIKMKKGKAKGRNFFKSLGFKNCFNPNYLCYRFPNADNLIFVHWNSVMKFWVIEPFERTGIRIDA